MSPVYFVIIYLILKNQNHNIWGLKNAYFKDIIPAIVSSFLYIYYSTFYQPDLDIRGPNRPGKNYFPIGVWALNYKLGHFLLFVTKPVNKFWHSCWKHFGRAFTHRGITHWPILSTLLRGFYVYMWSVNILLVFDLLGMTGHTYESFLSNSHDGSYKILGSGFFLLLDYMRNFVLLVKVWAKHHFFFLSGINKHFFTVFVLPAYVSDLFHIGIDYYDSMKKGSSFCPKPIPRGYFFNFFDTFIKSIRSFKKNSY